GLRCRDEMRKCVHQLTIRLMRDSVKCIMRHFLCLLHNGIYDLGVAMAKIEDTNTTDKINILTAFGIPNTCIFSVIQSNWVNNRECWADVGADSHGGILISSGVSKRRSL